MSFRSALTATGVVLSTALLLGFGVGCNGEDYSAKDPTYVGSGPGRFSAAGSTFIAPLFARWSTDYEKDHHMIVNYLPIGSGAALTELKENLLTFAASDAPLADAQLKELPPLVQIPVTAGPVCVIYNLATSAPLKLRGKTLAGIYSGQIKNWDASTIQTDNPGVKLPHTPITVVHRLDGSGTTSIFTTYLSAVSESWSARPGHGLEVQWPVGIGQNGSRAVLAAVKGTAGAIG
jgi:phosphate transport system substrate-binding protein